MNCPFSPIIDFTSLLGNVEGGLDKEDTGCDLAVSWLWMGRMPMWERDYGPIYMMPEISTYTKAQSLFLKDLITHPFFVGNGDLRVAICRTKDDHLNT